MARISNIDSNGVSTRYESQQDYYGNGRIRGYADAYREDEEDAEDVVLIEEEPYLDMVFSPEFFERITGFTYSCREDIMQIKTIPRYASDNQIIIVEEFRRDTRTNLRPELTHLNQLYLDYLDTLALREANERDRAITRDATMATQMVARQLDPDRVNPYSREVETLEEPNERVMDNIFGVHEDAIGVCESAEEEAENPEAHLSFQTGRTFMRGNNHDE